MPSRFMSAAFSGTRIDRNTIINKMNDITRTAPMNTGSRLVILSEMSMKKAVLPVTSVVSTWASSRAWGRTSLRRRWTSSWVSAS